MAQVALFPGVVVDIIDNTTLDGLQPSTLAFLEAAGAAALAAGLDHIQVTAGAGSDGHVSHYDGTEADLVGFNADGSRWRQDQRLAVAGGAREAGANRFGFYTNPNGSFSGNSLHLGTGPGGRNQNATWGFGGQTSGEGARSFTFPGEAAFAASIAGSPARQGQHGAPNRAPATGAAPPAQIAAQPAPETPESPVGAVLRSLGEQMAARPAAAATAEQPRQATQPLMAAADLENSRSKLGQMSNFLIPEPEAASTTPAALETPIPPVFGAQKPDFGAVDPLRSMFRGARPAALGGGIRVRG